MHKCFLPYLNIGYIKACFYCWYKNLLTITRSRTQKRSGFKRFKDLERLVFVVLLNAKITLADVVH